MILHKLKRDNIWYINKNWTIKSQILLASLLLWTLIFLTLLVITLVSQSFIQNQLQVTSTQIFLSETSLQLNNIWIFQNNIERMFLYTQNQVQSTQTIYIYMNSIVKSQNEYNFEWPQMALNDYNSVDKYCFSSSTTCGVFGKQFEETQKSELESVAATANILTQFRIAFDHTYQAPMYYFKDDQYQLYCITTGIPFPSSFIPNKRPYYLEFKKQLATKEDFKKIYFASPYQVVSGKIKIPMMTGLIDINNQLVGVVAKDIDFSYASVAQSKISNFTIYVIDQNGKIFYSLLYNHVNLNVSYFNDTNLTGFNQSDFEQVIKHHNNQSFQNNCENFEFHQILCLHNKKTKENLIIKSQQIINSPLILLLLIETNQIFQQNNAHVQLNYRYYESAIIQQVIAIIVIPIGFIFFASLMINIILKQLSNLILMIKLKIYPNKKVAFYNEIYRRKNFFDSDSVSELATAITQLFQNKIYNKKSQECQIIEKFNYPHEVHQKKKRLLHFVKQLKQNVDQFQNNKEFAFKGFQILKK